MRQRDSLTAIITFDEDDGELYLPIEFNTEEDVGGKQVQIVLSDINKNLIEKFSNYPNEIYKISGRRFEEIVAELFRGFGFDVELTKQSHDNGYDIIAIKSTIVERVKYLIECKRNAQHRGVGIGVVQRIHGATSSEQATKGFVVTTSYFSRYAQNFCDKNKWKLEPKDFDSLKLWMKQYTRRKRGVL